MARPVPAPAPVTPAARSGTIALILPLDVKAFSRAAEAVRAGFLAAAGAAGDQANCVVIAHGEDGVLAAFEDARAREATVIVGPLLRDDLKAVAQLALDLPFTVALNQLDEGTPSVPHLYTFSLGIESDARLIARRVRADGAPRVAVVGAETPLMKRFATAFATEWVADGGAAPDLYRFDGTADALTAMRRELVRKTPNAILMALDSNNATLAKPYLGTIPTYASGLVFERETQAVTRDLDDLVLVEIPWIITPDAAQFAQFPKQEFASAALTRLYALGLDAYRVARAFRDGPPERFTLEGATGQVTLVEGRQFAREGRFGVFRAGQLMPLDGPR
ncbi:MAG: penicillin-binding protein activator [Casimicrobiaceae bacterium]